MELKKRLSFRKIFLVLYFAFFLAYLVVGLQPAEASEESYDESLSIPSISLETPVKRLELIDHELETPAKIAGSFSQHQNKTLLIGHSTTVFENLKDIQLGDDIYYNNKLYKVTSSEIFAKSDINMRKVLSKTEKDTLIIMTCAGELLEGGDATHRLIVEAIEST